MAAGLVARLARRVGVALAMIVASWLVAGSPAGAAPAPINGSGSTYVGVAMQQWVAEAQSAGLKINYSPTGSPTGLSQYMQGLTDFAGTEAEFSSLLGPDAQVSRGYQYIPDVAGAIAILYNINDRSGRAVDYLRLSRVTIAKIFMGLITNWSDPQIKADNGGVVELPDEPIKVIYRGGESGTTALFYDFIQNMLPAEFESFVTKVGVRRDVRVLGFPRTPPTPNAEAKADSDLMARAVKSTPGAISYDEFGYAVTYKVNAARVDNESGKWILPYAANISAALESAELRPDLTQELRNVYRSRNPLAYPISAYSYIVTQCRPSADRPTCAREYPNAGTTETLTQWLHYIACEGQVSMASIGYSPLPPNLSQEIENAIGRLGGDRRELNAGNCANPRFHGDPGPAAPPDRIEAHQAKNEGGAGTGGPAKTDGGATSGGPAASDPDAPGAAEDLTAADSATGPVGERRSANGGSGEWRDPNPVAYVRSGPIPATSWPLIALLVVVLVPPLLAGLWRARSRARAN